MYPYYYNSHEKNFVTGSTGVIGSYVLQSLIRRGIDPKAGVRDVNKLNRDLQEQSEILHLDYNDSISIENALSDTDKIFLVPPMHPDMFNMMKNVLNKSKDINAIVCISASGADANSTFPLLRAHGEIKEAIVNTGIPFTFLAPAHFYQNYIEFCARSIQEEGKFYFPQGNTKKSMMDTYDIGEIAAKILTEEGHAGKTYNLSGYYYDNFEIASTFAEVLGKQVNYIDIDPEEYKKMLKENQMPDWKIEILFKLNAAWRAGSRLKSNKEARLLLSREPRTFEDFLSENKNKFI